MIAPIVNILLDETNLTFSCIQLENYRGSHDPHGAGLWKDPLNPMAYNIFFSAVVSHLEWRHIPLGRAANLIIETPYYLRYQAGRVVH